jgi:hypothetical protein
MRGMISDHSLLNWHKRRKDLISRKSGCGVPVTPAKSDRQRPAGARFGIFDLRFAPVPAGGMGKKSWIRSTVLNA